MCRTGGPYCYERKMNWEQRKKLNAKRIKRVTKRIKDDPSSDYDRTTRCISTQIVNDGKTVEEVEIEKIIEDTRQPDGGATFSLDRMESPTTGFCYSPYPERSVVLDSAEDLTPDVFDQYGIDNADLLKDGSGEKYIGLWNDPETGKVYLDVSVVVQDAQEARRGCEENDQIAFFDLQDFTSVTVDRNATSGQGEKTEEKQEEPQKPDKKDKKNKKKKKK